MNFKCTQCKIEFDFNKEGNVTVSYIATCGSCYSKAVA